MMMAYCRGIVLLLDRLKQQLKVYWQGRKKRFRNKVPPHGQFDVLDLEPWLEEHDGTPLVIGNELLITDDIVKLYHGLSNALGRVVIIDQVPTNEDRTIKASAFGIQVYVDMKVAQHMR